MTDVKLEVVTIENPGHNLILGQTHFIKTVEDVYEAITTSVPGAKFGVAFCEASGDCLIRWDGNDSGLVSLAQKNMQAIRAGHTFVVFLADCFPINVLNRIKDVSEVCHVIAATANPLQVLIAETAQGRGIMGVIDGTASDSIEDEQKRRERHEFLRKIGYKR